MSNFQGAKLEEMLRTSTKNVAQEVVSILIGTDENKQGVLSQIEADWKSKQSSS